MKLLQWAILLLFTQCFIYKEANFGPSLEMGITVTPDRLIFIIVFIFAVWKIICGELQLTTLGNLGLYILLFALICTISTFLIGRGSQVLYYLFDFNYNPFVMFMIAKSIPHNRKKLELLTFAFLAVGAYLAINGVFERFGPHALVWPKYILDSQIGIQFERTRGSFASSEGLGGALIVTFLFYVLYITRVKGPRLYCAYIMLFLTVVVIYATNQRAAWISFGLCLVLLTIAKSDMKSIARCLISIVLLGFFSGVSTHFSFWEDRTLFDKRAETVSYRKVNNLTTLEMGKANPIFGVGFGNFQVEWPKYFRPIEGSGIRDLTDGNHNTYLGRFAEVGLVGLIPYLMTFYYMFRVGLWVYSKGEGFERDFALVFLLVLLRYIIGGNFSDYRTAPFLNTVLFLLCGAVAGIEAHMREELRHRQVRVGYGMGTAGLSYKQWSEWKRLWDIQVTRFTRLPRQLDHV